MLILFHFDGVQENKDLLKCQIIPELFDTGKYSILRIFTTVDAILMLSNARLGSFLKCTIDIHISNGKYLRRHTTKCLAYGPLDSTPKCLYSCKIEIKHASLIEDLSCRTSQCLREGLNQTKHILACKIFWPIH